jgi:hypothetical protein
MDLAQKANIVRVFFDRFTNIKTKGREQIPFCDAVTCTPKARARGFDGGCSDAVVQ